jgi:hypothetical protein
MNIGDVADAMPIINEEPILRIGASPNVAMLFVCEKLPK